MSAAVVVLPTIWAYAETSSPWRPEHGAGRRKGPHALRLVQASGETAERALPAPQPVLLQAPKPRLDFYRKYTEAMLRRYLTMSMEAGRVPSMLGRELFRSQVTHYKVQSFEDVVIYVRDVEKCLSRLEAGQQHLVRRIALQGYTQGETSAMLGITLRTVVRRYAESLDRLTSMFLSLGLLEPRTESREGV